jgi:hypothetical protein
MPWLVLSTSRRILLRFFLVLAIIATLLWFVVPVELRNFLNKKGAELPDYVCHIDAVRLDVLLCGINLDGVQLVKQSGKIPVPFLTCPNIHIALQWRELLHLCFRSNITMTRPVVNFVQGPSEAQSQTFLEPVWVQEVEHLVPLQINRFEIVQGDIHYYEFDASPEIDLEMDQVELVLDNLSNSAKLKTEFPSTAVLQGRPFKRGKLELHMGFNTEIKQPTFKDQIHLQNIPAPALNSFLAKYASVYAKSGDLAFYSEMLSEKGTFKGYLKPFFQDLQFQPVPKDRNGLAALWATIMNGLKDVLENEDNVVATQIPVSGNYNNPDLDFWSAAFGLIKNAYFQALAQGFQHPELSPVPDKPAKAAGA